MRQNTRRRVIVTADDFGLHPAINEAVEIAHTRGILTATSLMVGEPAATDAVARARALPGLRVGLHLALADATPMLPPEDIPDLVDGNGRFGLDMARAGARFFFLPHVRRQLAAEIRAQFRAFATTGLQLDHVNAHKHFHFHPTILGMMLSIGREFGLRAVRLPHEPVLPSLRMSGSCGGAAAKSGWAAFLSPWTTLMRARLQRAGVKYNDAIFGLSANGAMNETTLLAILKHLPQGVSELYFHPATQGEVTDTMSDYAMTDELAALTSTRVKAVLERGRIETIGFSELTDD